MEPEHILQQLAKEKGIPITSIEFMKYLDEIDPLKHLRNEFIFPKVSQIRPKNAPAISDELLKKDCVYLCGNSLGLQPRHTRQLLLEELDVWAERGVEGHFDHKFNRPWVSIDETVTKESARIVGAKLEEVAVMNTLTANLHFLLVSFYRPTPKRHKIIIEEKAFPSDHYAVISQINFHKFSPDTSLITVAPRQNEFCLRDEDILKVIEEHGESTALILFSGVQYYTGQLFDIEKITSAGRQKGCVVGWDLAHAVGNVELKLNEWGPDFACWCSYKYLNAGPGGIGGVFVHERHAIDVTLPRFAGWWGHDKISRFKMINEFKPMPGAAGWQLSNPSVLATVALLGSLKVFEITSMKDLRKKSILLTGYLEYLIKTELSSDQIRIITPSNSMARGAQLSLHFPKGDMSLVFKELLNEAVICDKREPDVIRVAPAPLYCTFSDVRRFVDILINIIGKRN